MSDRRVVVHVHITGGSLPEGTILALDSWSIYGDGERKYFRDTTEVSGVQIPKDTVLVFDPPYQPGEAKAKATAITGTWSLFHGIHQGGIMSRDEEWQHGFESLEAVRKVYEQVKQRLGPSFYCWFAYAYAPGRNDEEKVKIDEPVSYRR